MSEQVERAWAALRSGDGAAARAAYNALTPAERLELISLEDVASGLNGAEADSLVEAVKRLHDLLQEGQSQACSSQVLADP